MTEKELETSMAAFAVPSHLRGGIARWIMSGIEPGGFMQCVLQNDLRGAVTRASTSSRAGFLELVHWLIAEAPPQCWGSEGAYVDWANSGGWSALDEGGKRSARLVR
jgi:hypothetical protein